MRTPCLHIIILAAFIFNTVVPFPQAKADDFHLPQVGAMVPLSLSFNPPILKGIKVHPENPFRFDFILDTGVKMPGGGGVLAKSEATKQSQQEQLKQQSTKLIKYFLASLTTPDQDLWVNLSPYEKNRIIPQSFGLTEMGRDMLAEDYMLKQITASLIYPEGETGKKFWKRIYEEAVKKFSTTNIPVNTFNKVWILPEKAVVFENAKNGTAYVVESKLKVMLEEDYLSLIKHNRRPGVGPINGRTQGSPLQNVNGLATIGANIIRQIIIPQLTQEINQGQNFAQLRQVYNSLILATWYKKKIKDSLLAQVYENKNKIQGLVIPAKAGIQNKNNVEYIYHQYLQAFKKGAYNYIKEEQDPLTHENMPRKYFSGGEVLVNVNNAMVIATDPGVLPHNDGAMNHDDVIGVRLDKAMAAGSEGIKQKLSFMAQEIRLGRTRLTLTSYRRWEKLHNELSFKHREYLIKEMQGHGFSPAEIKKFFLGVIDRLPSKQEKEDVLNSFYNFLIVSQGFAKNKDLWEILNEFDDPKVRILIRNFIFYKAPLLGAKKLESIYYTQLRPLASNKNYKRMPLSPYQSVQFLMGLYQSYPRVELSGSVLVMLNMGMGSKDIRDYFLREVPSLYFEGPSDVFYDIAKFIDENELKDTLDKDNIDAKFLMYDLVQFHQRVENGYSDSISRVKRLAVMDKLKEIGFFKVLKEKMGLKDDETIRLGWLMGIMTSYYPIRNHTEGDAKYLECITTNVKGYIDLLKGGILSDLMDLGLDKYEALRLALKIAIQQNRRERNISDVLNLVHYVALSDGFKKLIRDEESKPYATADLVFNHLLDSKGFAQSRENNQVDDLIKVMSYLSPQGLKLKDLCKIFLDAEVGFWHRPSILTDIRNLIINQDARYLIETQGPITAIGFAVDSLHDGGHINKDFVLNVAILNKQLNGHKSPSILDVLRQNLKNERLDSNKREALSRKYGFIEDILKNKMVEFLRDHGVLDESIVLFINALLEKSDAGNQYQRSFIWAFINSMAQTNAVGVLSGNKRSFAQIFHQMAAKIHHSVGGGVWDDFEKSLESFASLLPNDIKYSDERLRFVLIGILGDMLLNLENSSVRKSAIALLCKSRDPKAEEILINAIKDPDVKFDIKVAVLEELWRFNTSHTFVFLKELANDSSADTLLRQKAIESLGKISNSASGVELVSLARKTTDPEIKKLCLMALGSKSIDLLAKNDGLRLAYPAVAGLFSELSMRFKGSNNVFLRSFLLFIILDDQEVNEITRNLSRWKENVNGFYDLLEAASFASEEGWKKSRFAWQEIASLGRDIINRGYSHYVNNLRQLHEFSDERYALFCQLMVNDKVDLRLRMKIEDNFYELLSIRKFLDSNANRIRMDFNRLLGKDGKEMRLRGALVATWAEALDGLNKMIVEITAPGASPASQRKLQESSKSVMEILRKDFLSYILDHEFSSAELALLNDDEIRSQVMVVLSIISRLSERQDAEIVMKLIKDFLKILFVGYDNASPNAVANAKNKLNELILNFNLDDLSRARNGRVQIFKSNKETIQELIANGYSKDLWEKGVEFEMFVSESNDRENVLRAIRQSSFEMVEIALALGMKRVYGQDISIERSPKIDTYVEAEFFFKEIEKSVKEIPEQSLNRLKEILQIIQDKERELDIKNGAGAKFRVTIKKDFLSEAVAGLGVPGCYAPTGIHNETPLKHAMEVNVGFIQVYNSRGNQVANAVIVYGIAGAYVYPVFNSTRYDMDIVFGKALAELARYVPKLYLDQNSAGYKYLEQYKDEVVMNEAGGHASIVKTATIFEVQYYDSGSVDGKGELTIGLKDPLIVTKASLEAKGGLAVVTVVKKGKKERKLIDKDVSRGIYQVLKSAFNNKYLFMIGPLNQRFTGQENLQIGDDFIPWFNGKVQEVLKENFNPEESEAAAQIVIRLLKQGDRAQISKYGGIDLTSRQMDQIMKNRGEFKIGFHVDPVMLKKLQNASGLVPVIISIQPLKSLYGFLGVDISPVLHN